MFYIYTVCKQRCVLLVCSALSMEMLALQHILGGIGIQVFMVESLQKSEIPAGWDLCHFQSTSQKIYI